MIFYYLKGHLQKRNLQIERYPYVTIDDENEVVVFRLWNLSGQMVGYQQYRPWGSKSEHNSPKEGKYFTYISPGQLGYWGSETLEYKPGILFLCEGIFDACRIHNYNLPAIACLSNNPTQLIPWLKILGRRVIAVPDTDSAGEKLKALAGEAIDISQYLTGVNHGSCDLGRLKEHEVKSLLAPYL
jgi:hypothetical protein